MAITPYWSRFRPGLSLSLEEFKNMAITPYWCSVSCVLFHVSCGVLH